MEKHTGKNYVRIFKTYQGRSFAGRKAFAEKRSISCSVDLPASGKSHQSPLEDEKVLQESGMFREEVMEALGIENDWLERYPRELSGGELQRFCVARSLFSGTHFLFADEMSTMLDVITQAQIWNLMLKEVEERKAGTFNGYPIMQELAKKSAPEQSIWRKSIKGRISENVCKYCTV